MELCVIKKQMFIHSWGLHPYNCLHFTRAWQTNWHVRTNTQASGKCEACVTRVGCTDGLCQNRINGAGRTMGRTFLQIQVNSFMCCIHSHIILDGLTLLTVLIGTCEHWWFGLCVYLRMCVLRCLRACVRACVRVCVRACVRAYVDRWYWQQLVNCMYRPYNIHGDECHTYGHMSVPWWNICIHSYSLLTSTQSCGDLCCMCSCCSQLDKLKYFNQNRCTSVEHSSHMILCCPL